MRASVLMLALPLMACGEPAKTVSECPVPPSHERITTALAATGVSGPMELQGVSPNGCEARTIYYWQQGDAQGRTNTRTLQYLDDGSWYIIYTKGNIMTGMSLYLQKV